MATNPVARMTGAALFCFGVLAAAAGTASTVPVLLGMVGPLVVTVGSWMVLERVHARGPEHVPRALVTLFGAKMILVGAYVAAVIVLLHHGRPVFVASFVSHYILLHVMEALYLRRLFSARHIDGQRLGVS